MAADDAQPDIPAVPGLWRRKTEPLEVMHWDGSARSATAVIDWILANGGTARYHDDPARLRIDLPRGTVDALPGDRIIKAEDGTFRPLDEPGFFSLLEPVGVLVSSDVTSPAPGPASPPAASTEPPAPVSEAAVQAALDSVAPFWKEAHAVLQAYPSAALARAMLEGAAPLIRAEAEAKLAAQREYDTYRRALWAMVRQFGGSVFLTSVQMEDVPLLASLGIGREPGGIRINAGEEP